MLVEQGQDAEEDSNMKLVVLGANGYQPNDLGHTACFAIPELGIILDAGTGMYRMADYLETAQLDVYLSHDHRDHTWGLAHVEFMFYRRMVHDAVARNGKATLAPIFQSLHGSPPRVRVHVAEEHLQRVQHLVGKRLYDNLIEYVPLHAAEHLPGGGKLSSFPVQHRGNKPCFGFRLDRAGRSLAYVTDTYGEPGAGYVEEIRGADLLLHECTMPDDEPDLARQVGHSHITPVAQLAAEAQVGRLVLIHLSAFRPEHGEPELDRARAIFPRTEVAFDRMEIEF
jgi:ribonuclease Z